MDGRLPILYSHNIVITENTWFALLLQLEILDCAKLNFRSVGRPGLSSPPLWLFKFRFYSPGVDRLELVSQHWNRVVLV
ncbi:hypothetical protein QLX08_001399 [Tetragonisca angustula]|uniref:Uncharacterized protein n=1 Tax=Tetragonisca angustula TaxID=166442 RepID=A0AAW1AHV3_9HYME